MSNQTVFEQRLRYFYLAAMAIFFIRFLSSALFSQLGQPVLVYPSLDLSIWGMLLLGIPQFFTQSIFIPALADISLFMLPLMAIFLEETRSIWAFLFSLLVAIYITTYGIYSGHHFHGLMMLFFGSISFWQNKKTAILPNESHSTRSQLLVEGVRYYFLFIFASAFCWKLLRGGLFDSSQMVNILRAQHADYLFENSTSFFASVYYWILQHPLVSQLLLLAAAILQGLFFVGFFTKKYDYFLAAAAIVFCVANYFVMGIPSWELLVGLLFLNIAGPRVGLK